MVDSRLMAKVRQASVPRGSDGAEENLRATRDGALCQIPWMHALSLEGRIYGCHLGVTSLTINDPCLFGVDGGDGIIEVTEHDLLQTIPEQVVVIPTYFQVGFVAIAVTPCVAMHTALWWGSLGVAGANPITYTPFNLKPGSGNLSKTTVVGQCDTGGTGVTAAGIIYSLATTAETSAADDPAPIDIHWSAREAGFTPFLEGKTGTGMQVAAAACAEAGTGYMTYQWAELPISAIA